MLGELFRDIFGELVFKPILFGLSYGLGKLVVFVLTGGAYRMTTNPPPKKVAEKMQWNEVSYLQGGKRYLLPEIPVLVGIATWIAIGVAIYFLMRQPDV